MALKRALTAGWLLSDGILNTFPIGDPCDALTAVTEAHFAPDPFEGMNLMGAEWVYNRRWRYESHFDAPKEDDERVWLLFERLSGAGKVLVNGRPAGRFTGGEALIEVTEQLVPGENELSVCFEAPGLRLPAENPMPLLGLTGPVSLLTGNGLSLESLTSRPGDGKLAIDLALNVFAAGRYTFAYVASQDGALRRRWRFEEDLADGHVELTHTLSGLDEPDSPQADRHTFAYAASQDSALWQRWQLEANQKGGRKELTHTLNRLEKSENEVAVAPNAPLDVCLDITRSGVGCAQARFESRRPGSDEPRRTLLVRGGLTEDLAEALRAVGADSVWPEDDPAVRVKADSLFGLARVSEGEPFSCPACVRDLRAEAGDEAFWPPRSPIWRLRGGQAPDIAALSALYGKEAQTDGALAARLSRYEQAEAVLHYALDCRARGERAIVPWNAAWESLSSDAVTERGGRRRMACDALRRAWSQDAVWADWPAHETVEPGAALEIALWAATDKKDGLTVRLEASAWSMDGRCLARKEETVNVRQARRVGALSLTAPEDGVVIVRCALRGGVGRILCRLDRVLPVKGEGAPLKALIASPAALTLRGKAVVNAGQVAALAVGECLLPGEQTDTAEEWVNGETAAE